MRRPQAATSDRRMRVLRSQADREWETYLYFALSRCENAPRAWVGRWPDLLP
jgi:hypothetical protein